MTKIVYVCSVCKSRDIEFPGTFRWNENKQVFDTVDVYTDENVICFDCGMSCPVEEQVWDEANV